MSRDVILTAILTSHSLRAHVDSITGDCLRWYLHDS